MKKNIAKIFSLLVVGILLVGVLCGVTAYANTNDETVKIVFNNVEYGEKMKLMFAVDVPDGMSARVDICNENGTVLATTTQGEDEAIEGVTYKTFTSDLGVSAQNISTVVYAKAYLLDAEGNETGATDTQRYSVLEYLYKRLNVDTDVTTEQRAMYESCLEYAKYAEKVLTNTAEEDRIENYVYVAVKNGTIDGTFSAGIYKKGTPALSAIAADLVAGENEKIVYTVGNTSYTEEKIKAYVVNDHTVVNVSVEVASQPITTQYTFADYTAGTQYAENEEHVLDDNITVVTTQAHFTTQLRLYSSSTHDGYAIIKSDKTITSITLNAGYKVDTLNVYGSSDGGATWTLIKGVSVTSTSYEDYTVDISGEYTQLKLDVAGSQQVRIASMTITME